jgi:hypothetical protein
VAKASGLISIDVNPILERKLQEFFQLGEKKIRWAIADAMTSAGKDTTSHLKRIAPDHIDRPTPFTLRSVGRWPGYVKPQHLNQWVGFKKPSAAARHYLEPIVFGGGRDQKRSEARLNTAGILTRFMVPTGLAPLGLNRYGNVPQGANTQVLSRLKAFNSAGFDANRSNSKRSKRKRKDRDFFAAKLPGTSTPAIYARLGRRGGKGKRFNAVRPVFILTNKQPRYSASFPVGELLSDRYRQRFSAAVTYYLRKKL